MKAEKARQSRKRLLDALDAMHVLGVGTPITYDAWRLRFSGRGGDGHRSWERFRRWIREAELPVEWANLSNPRYGEDGRVNGANVELCVVFRGECWDLVVGLLDALLGELPDEDEAETA